VSVSGGSRPRCLAEAAGPSEPAGVRQGVRSIPIRQDPRKRWVRRDIRR
jgi:hypothetical protein